MTDSLAVDTSAVIAILKREAEADRLITLIGRHHPHISAGTLAELLIVAEANGLARPARDLLDAAAMTIVAVDADMARRVAEAYAVWGKGVHPAGLTFGDCFSYALAKSLMAPLACAGTDFAKTDCRIA